MNGKSIVFWSSDEGRHRCGYCKSETGNISNGMWVKILTVEDYQNLIDRGWRRSGAYCYKPIMSQVCCPMYTIKCDAENFQISKSQKKVAKKINKFLKDGEITITDQHHTGDSHESHEFMYTRAPKNFSEDICDTELISSVKESNPPPLEPEISTILVPCNSKSSSEVVTPKGGLGADPNRPPCKKAKTLRLERKQEKLLKRGMNLEKNDSKHVPKKLEDFLEIALEDNKHQLKLELVPSNRENGESDHLTQVEFELYQKYQTKIHNDPPHKCTMSGFLRFLVNSPLQITLDQLTEDHKHFKLAAALFQKYQISVHNDNLEECSESQFEAFLVDTPLQNVPFGRGSQNGFGSYHQLYWLDDKLIAVGVIDILPRCVSAVYFFYDPDYRNLTLGTYGSLKEVELTRALQKEMPSIKDYYMGFYIHSCPKMRYKGKLSPSYLLCPETYNWFAIEKCVEKLEVNKYCRFAEESVIDEDSCSRNDIDNIKVLANRKLGLYKDFRRFYHWEKDFKKIGTLVGKTCARSIIFIPNF